MKNRTCPKCGKKEIYFKQNRQWNKRNIWITDFSEGVLSYYVCVNCGYLESYLEREKDLEKIKRKWKEL